MFGFFKKRKPNKNDLTDDNGNVIQKSSIQYNKNNRYLQLEDDACAIVMHADNNVEVVFTKLYDPENQTISENEEQLMALALFMKRPGFMEILLDEFRKVAREHINNLTKDE